MLPLKFESDQNFVKFKELLKFYINAIGQKIRTLLVRPRINKIRQSFNYGLP